MLPPLDQVPVHVPPFAARAPCDSKGSECQVGIHRAEAASALRSRKTERAAKEKLTPISQFFLAPAAPGPRVRTGSASAATGSRFSWFIRAALYGPRKMKAPGPARQHDALLWSKEFWNPETCPSAPLRAHFSKFFSGTRSVLPCSLSN